LTAAAAHKDRMVLVEAVLPRLDIPDLLSELTGPTSPDGSARR
jgi:indolepyruvate decarboxylase